MPLAKVDDKNRLVASISLFWDADETGSCSQSDCCWSHFHPHMY
jgi:hypothetical protein